MTEQHNAGSLLRQWRQRRRYSQLALALEAEISQRHLSFIESGRSQPSRDMLMHLADRLDVPLRGRNLMLMAADFAPAYGERALASPELAAARDTIDHVLSGHAPHPAVAVDRYWTLLSANRALGILTEGASSYLLEGTSMSCVSACIQTDSHRGSSISVNGEAMSLYALSAISRFVEILNSSLCSKNSGHIPFPPMPLPLVAPGRVIAQSRYHWSSSMMRGRWSLSAPPRFLVPQLM